MPEIKINNLGPIEEFRYDMAEPGLHLLLGEQGSGKSTTLRTVELATQGETSLKPVKRDGSKVGEATIAGKTLKISRTTREEGELSVEGLGDLDITTLHWPRFEKPEIRDKYRIATLCRLAGLKGSVEDFKAVVTEEEWNTLVGPKVTITDDVVELAMRVKRAIDGAALNVEKLAETAEANAVAETKLFEGVDLTGPSDEKALAEAYEAAVGNRHQLQGAAEASEKSKAAVEAAQKSLALIPVVDVAAVERDVEEDVKTADDEHQTAIRATVTAKAEVDRLQAALQDAADAVAQANRVESDARQKAETMKRSAKEQVQAARQAMEQRAEHERAIQVAATTGPTEMDLVRADADVSSALDAMNHGQKLRVAIKAKATHDEHVAKKKALAKQASKLRDSAKAALAILGDAIAKIPNCPLKVIETVDGDTRLVVLSDRSDEEFFDELSDGERWKMIVPLCLGPDRLIVLPQAAFGEMAPSTAAMLDTMIRDQKAYVLTARAEDVPLQGMSYRDWIKAKA